MKNRKLYAEENKLCLKVLSNEKKGVVSRLNDRY
jgi:hypothetical protein